MCVLAQMATLEKAEGLLEELRGASYDAAVKDMDELKAYATENVSYPSILVLPRSPILWLCADVLYNSSRACDCAALCCRSSSRASPCSSQKGALLASAIYSSTIIVGVEAKSLWL